jgi:hypothetical protein
MRTQRAFSRPSTLMGLIPSRDKASSMVSVIATTCRWESAEQRTKKSARVVRPPTSRMTMSSPFLSRADVAVMIAFSLGSKTGKLPLPVARVFVPCSYPKPGEDEAGIRIPLRPDTICFLVYMISRLQATAFSCLLGPLTFGGSRWTISYREEF